MGDFRSHERTPEVYDDPGSFDYVRGLQRMSFGGFTDHDKVTEKQKATIQSQPCKCMHGTEECCQFETHEQEHLLEYFEAPT